MLTPSFDKATLACTLPWDASWVTAVALIGNSRKLAAGTGYGKIVLLACCNQRCIP